MPAFTYRPVLLVLLAVLAAVGVDRHYSAAGLVAALALSATTGVAHGAADVWLLTRFISAAPRRIAALLAYLLAVLLIAAALIGLAWLGQAAVALVLLIALSLWHFGEGYADDRNLAPSRVLLLRLVRGGAPIAAPALTSFAALQALLHSTLGAQADTALLAFKVSLALWLGALVLLVLWALVGRHSRNPAESARSALSATKGVLIECALVLALNAVTSPLMAFALYFGVFHALSHIERLRKLDATAHTPNLLRFTVLATVTTLLLCGALLGVLYAAQQQPGSGAWQAISLQTLIIALCALTAPHVVLISRLAKRLA